MGREDIDDDGDDSNSEYMGDFDELSKSFMVSLDEEDKTEMEFAAVGFDQ